MNEPASAMSPIIRSPMSDNTTINLVIRQCNH
jgi:hypothetical protein